MTAGGYTASALGAATATTGTSGEEAAAAATATTNTTTTTTEERVYRSRWLAKGNVSQLISLLVLLLGIAIAFPSGGNARAFGEYVMSLGLFGLAGGLTNHIAVTMLFYRIRFVYGSGVVPNRYREIRTGVKDTIMETFFDPDFLREHLGRKLKEAGADIDAPAQVARLIETDEFDALVGEKLEAMQGLPVLAGMAAAGMKLASLKPIVKTFVANLGKDLAPFLATRLTDAKLMIDANAARKAIDAYMSERVQTLTEQRVVNLLLFVIRKHLDWLVVWGCVFGGIIGLVAHAAGGAPDYVHGG